MSLEVVLVKFEYHTGMSLNITLSKYSVYDTVHDSKLRQVRGLTFLVHPVDLRSVISISQCD